MRRIVGVLLLLSMSSMGVSAQVRGETQIQSASQANWRALRVLITRIEDRADLLRSGLSVSTGRNSVYGSRVEDNASGLLGNFSGAVQRLHQRLNQRQATADDAQEVLDGATALDRYIRRHPVNAQTQRYWSNLRVDLNQLARVYGLSWSTTTGGYRNYPNGEYGNYPTTPSYPTRPAYVTGQLTGTYRLDSSRSDDPRNTIDSALRSLPYEERQPRRDQLLRRLEAPEQIAVEVRGQTVTLASTKAPQISFDADGRERTETTPAGRSIQVRSTFSGDQLTVTTTGDRDNQFNVTFNVIDNGRRLRVTRRVYAADLSTPVEIQSYYDRIADVAQFNIYNGSQGYPVAGNTNDFLLRSGDTVVAELNDPLMTSTSREGDRFTATVRLPEQYAGATIEGHVSSVQRSGRITGRSEMTLNFDRIRLRDGGSYRFAGILETVRMPNGETARIDNEGAVQESSQSQRTVERAAIGTAIGALIGAIAGGGKGAAIGAVVGAGGGAGSVYVQGQGDLELPRGTEVTIQATGPNR